MSITIFFQTASKEKVIYIISIRGGRELLDGYPLAAWTKALIDLRLSQEREERSVLSVVL